MLTRNSSKGLTLAFSMLAAATSHAAEVKEKDIPAETKQEIKERCTAKWKDHEDRYKMTAFCIKQEVQAWAEVENFK